MVIELQYCNTNTYLIKGTEGYLLFDTGWASTFSAFCKALGEHGIAINDIKYLMISHFHPDHMGIAQEIAEHGAKILVFDVQETFVHASDAIFQKENNKSFIPIDDEKVTLVEFAKSREVLGELGFVGEVFATPGHSEDSISLLLDTGELFVGDLNPLYELELHKGTAIYESWQKLLCHNPSVVYYGHAKSTKLAQANCATDNVTSVQQKQSEKELYRLVKQIMKYIDMGKSIEWIQKKTGADIDWIQDVTRMYLTHQNVSVQGILDRIEIKGR